MISLQWPMLNSRPAWFISIWTFNKNFGLYFETANKNDKKWIACTSDYVHSEHGYRVSTVSTSRTSRTYAISSSNNARKKKIFETYFFVSKNVPKKVIMLKRASWRKTRSKWKSYNGKPHDKNIPLTWLYTNTRLDCLVCLTFSTNSFNTFRFVSFDFVFRFSVPLVEFACRVPNCKILHIGYWLKIILYSYTTYDTVRPGCTSYYYADAAANVRYFISLQKAIYKLQNEQHINSPNTTEPILENGWKIKIKYKNTCFNFIFH